LQRGHPRVSGTPEAAAAFAEHAHLTFDWLTAAAAIQARTCRVDNPNQGREEVEATIHARAKIIGEFLEQHALHSPGGAPSQPVAVAPSQV
jgi:hypothetical protein